MEWVTRNLARKPTPLGVGVCQGVNEKRIYEFNIFGDSEQYCNVFVEKPIDKIELWLDAKFYYQSFVKCGRTRYMTRDIRKSGNGEYEYYCQKYTNKDGFKNEFKWISEDKLEYD